MDSLVKISPDILRLKISGENFTDDNRTFSPLGENFTLPADELTALSFGFLGITPTFRGVKLKK